MQLKSTCGPHAMLPRFVIQLVKHYSSNWFNCLIVWQSQASTHFYRIRESRGFPLKWCIICLFYVIDSQINGGGAALNHLPLLFCKSVYYFQKRGK